MESHVDVEGEAVRLHERSYVLGHGRVDRLPARIVVAQMEDDRRLLRLDDPIGHVFLRGQRVEAAARIRLNRELVRGVRDLPQHARCLAPDLDIFRLARQRVALVAARLRPHVPSEGVGVRPSVELVAMNAVAANRVEGNSPGPASVGYMLDQACVVRFLLVQDAERDQPVKQLPDRERPIVRVFPQHALDVAEQDLGHRPRAVVVDIAAWPLPALVTATVISGGCVVVVMPPARRSGPAPGAGRSRSSALPPSPRLGHGLLHSHGTDQRGPLLLADRARMVPDQPRPRGLALVFPSGFDRVVHPRPSLRRQHRAGRSAHRPSSNARADSITPRLSRAGSSRGIRRCRPRASARRGDRPSWVPGTCQLSSIDKSRCRKDR